MLVRFTVHLEMPEFCPEAGDKTYQMDPRNKYEAIIEAELDEFEGADMLMVKPAMCYLDVIHQLNNEFNLPIAAYNVSGEYAMVHAAAQNGWLDYKSTMIETLTSIKECASIILTYFAKIMQNQQINGFL